jgi:predicted membrane protein
MTADRVTTSGRISITPRLIIGLAILALGTLWTLDNLNLLESESFTRWWPIALIAIGIVQYVNRRTNRVGPVAWMIAGAFLLANNVLDYDFDLGDLIPFAIALFGAKLVWDALARRSARTTLANDDSTVNAFAMMAGVHWQSTSRAFRGGAVSALMGGVEIDLRNVQIQPGDEVIIDALAIMGGVEIFVPVGWKIVASVLPFMGGFEDKTAPGSDTGSTLQVHGTAFMGAIVVKN